MRAVSRSALVRHSAEFMFDLVDDVSAYPGFLPWCVSTEVHSIDGAEMDASLAISRSGIETSFRTLNRRDPGRSIHVDLIDGPFETLEGEWRFEPLGDDGSKISLDLRFAIASPVLRVAFEPVFAEIADSMVDAFVRRADEVAGGVR